MNEEKPRKSLPSVVSLSPVEIEKLASWTAKRPRPLPKDKRRLKRQDLESVVTAWRQRNGGPEKPVSVYWQEGGAWKQGPNLSGMDLAGRKLHKIDLAGVIAQYADLEGAHLYDANLAGAWLWRSNLRQARLNRSDLSGAVLYESDLTDVEFFRADLRGVHFTGAILERTRLLDADLSGAYFYRARLYNAEMMAEQLGGAIGEDRDNWFRGAMEAYSRLKANFESIGRYGDAGWAYRKERRMSKRWSAEQARTCYKEGQYLSMALHWIKYLKDWTVELICDYGESVWRILGWGACLFFFVGPVLVYICGGLVHPDTSWRVDGVALQKAVIYYPQYLLHMVDTFTTADYAQWQPANDTVRLVSGLISLIAIFLVGLLGFVAGNRIRNV